jgi:hypothetical protein
VPVDVRGARAWVRTEIKGVALKGYQLMKIRPPDRVLKIEKMQNNAESGESVVTQNFSETKTSC